jgi:serine/threonine protein kinase
MADEATVSQVKKIGNLDTLRADPRFKNIVKNVYPLTGKISNKRTTKRSLGRGTFGRVNLEEVNEGEVATKYFTSSDRICDNSTEIATLKYLKGLPNVAQLIKVVTKPVGYISNTNTPMENLAFPAAVMGKAVSSLSDQSIYKNWDDVYKTIVQILRGYSVLHLRNVAHRDTKPANMLKTAAGEVWITDFGMSRYLPRNIPIVEDAYTGTLPYAAPELLMSSYLNRHAPINYYKSDCWAVGVSIYNILTGQLLFKGSDTTSILDHIFRIKGTPSSSDGDLYVIYNDYDYEEGIEDKYEQDEEAIRKRVYERTIHKPSDLTLLNKMGEIVSQLLNYDPLKRPKIREILEKLGEPLPILPPPKNLLSQYITKINMPETITEHHIDVLFGWLYDYTMHSAFRFSYKSHHVILDRMGVYFFSFLKIYEANPYIQVANLKLIGLVSLMLAACFFDVGSYSFTPGDIIVAGYPKKEMEACLKMFLTADIDFYGQTVLDLITNSDPIYNTSRLQTYGLLNYVCFQKNLFPTSKEELPRLIEIIKDYASSSDKIGFDIHLAKKYKIHVGDEIEGKMKNFIISVKLLVKKGGKKTRRISKKSKRQSKRQRRKTGGDK